MTKKTFLMCAAAVSLAAAAIAQEASPGPAYAGAAGAMVIPQGGGRMRRLGGGVARGGRYLSDALALECEAGAFENGAAMAARGLWHAQGWDWFGMLFGYERFDPFLSAGVRGWAPRGQVGPCFGVGMFYYIDNSWALRADFEATLGLDSSAEADFSISVGLQYSF